jgi:hypothetical protein
MTIDPVEVIKFVVGIGGLLSIVFLIYDRLIKSPLTVFLRPRDRAAWLVLKNAMPETLIIDSIEVTPPNLGIALGDDLRPLLKAVSDAVHESGPERTSVIIDPLADRMCKLINLSGFDSLPADAVFKIKCHWRSTARPSYVKRSVTVSTTAGDVVRMRNEPNAMPKDAA